MRGNFFRIIIVAVIFLSVYGQSMSAGGPVETLSGKVRTVMQKKNLSVFLLDKDGTILDIATLDSNGNYMLDLTVMDDPVYDELLKLKLRIADKKGIKKEVRVSKNIVEFVDKKVKLEPLNFP